MRYLIDLITVLVLLCHLSLLLADNMSCDEVSEFRHGRYILCTPMWNGKGVERKYSLLNLWRHLQPNKRLVRVRRLKIRCHHKVLVTITDTTDVRRSFPRGSQNRTTSPSVYLTMEGCIINWQSLHVLQKHVKIRGIILDENATIVQETKTNGMSQQNNASSASKPFRDVRILRFHHNNIREHMWLPDRELFPNLNVFIHTGTDHGMTQVTQSLITTSIKLRSLRVLILYKTTSGMINTACDTFMEIDRSPSVFVDNVMYGTLIDSIGYLRLPIYYLPPLLHFRGSDLIDLPENCLSNTIERLYLQESRLKTFIVSKDTVKRPDFMLVSLHLANNQIEFFEGMFLLSNLEDINMSKNKIERITEDNCVGLKRLRYLDLSYNKLKYIDRGCFIHTANLEFLNVQNNELKHFDIVELIRLEYVLLNGNFLSHIPPIVWILPNLRKLDISKNRIKIIEIPKYFVVPDRPEISELFINLADNPVVDLSGFLSTAIQILRRISLHINMITCDCKLRELRNTLRDILRNENKTSDMSLQNYRFYCGSPTVLAGKSLLYVSDNDLMCHVTTDCPQTCQCYRISSTHVTVTCDKIQSLPDTVPQNTTELNLRGNHITILDGFDYLNGLTTIDLSRCDIYTLTDNFVRQLHDIKINLTNNKLRSLPQALNDANINEIYLSQNRFVCDCQNADTINWIQKNIRIIPDVSNVFCGQEYANKSILNVHVDDLCKQYQFIPAIVSIIITTVCIICILFVTVRYRWKIRYWLKLRHQMKGTFDDEEEEDKKYDAFINYSEDDSKWMREVVKRLENYHKPFKTCVYERDFIPGGPLVDQIVDSIYNSRRVVYIVTMSFLTNDLCRLAVEIGTGRKLLSNKDFMVLILFPGVTLKTIRGHRTPRTRWLEVMIEAGDYLDAEDPHFWEKLFLAMPRRKRQHVAPEVAVDVTMDAHMSGDESLRSSLL